jgi:protoheme IX farnesyltransferase
MSIVEMSTVESQALVCKTTRAGAWSRVADYIELTKPKIAVMELAAIAASALVAAWGAPPLWPLMLTLFGTGLLAASASALNQWLERELDSLMPRTADRPIPQGRVTSSEAVAFGAMTAVAGAAALACVNLATLALGLATWTTYVCLYTPLKTRSTANTTVGAVAGALPVLIGWASTGRPLDLVAAALFVVLFLWQFPHFMAIAWLYRDDYAAANMRMLSVVDPSGRRAGAQAVVAALALVPVSLVPALAMLAPVYLLIALALGAAQCASALAFCVRRDEPSARRLLGASLVYLPALLIALVVSTAGIRAGASSSPLAVTSHQPPAASRQPATP